MQRRWKVLAVAGPLLSLVVVAVVTHLLGLDASSSQALRLSTFIVEDHSEQVDLTSQQRRELEAAACRVSHQVTMRSASVSRGARGLVANVTCNPHAYVKSYPVTFDLVCNKDLDDQPGWSCDVLWEAIQTRFRWRRVFIFMTAGEHVPVGDAYQAVGDLIAAGDLLCDEQLNLISTLNYSVSSAREGLLEVFCVGNTHGVAVERQVSPSGVRYVKVRNLVIIE